MDEKKRKPTIVEELEALAPNAQYKNPLKDMSPELLAQWEDLKKAINAGRMNHISLNEIHRRVCLHFGINMPRTTFRDFLVKEGVKKPKSPPK